MQIKNTIYDILGYLMPGTLFVVLILLGWAHYKEDGNLLNQYWQLLPKFSNWEMIIIFGVLYVIGHITSSVSSYAIESWLKPDDKILLGPAIYKEYASKVKELYQSEPDSKVFRLCVCHVESKQPQVYNTAFVFLSFYGMSRNISFLLSAFGIWEVLLLINAILHKKTELIKTSFLWCIAAVVLATITFYTYRRFVKYFRQHIICGFILKEG